MPLGENLPPAYTKATCKLCKEEIFPFSENRMLRHLRNKHPELPLAEWDKAFTIEHSVQHVQIRENLRNPANPESEEEASD